MPTSNIRPLALCLFKYHGRILVNEAHDSVKNQRFFRPIGGGINFGESGALAVAREVREELNAEVTDLQFVGTLENIFTYNGAPGHEIVLIYDGKNYGEPRIICYGRLSGRLVVIGYTPRGATRHVFSMRKANDREKARLAPYFEV